LKVRGYLQGLKGYNKKKSKDISKDPQRIDPRILKGYNEKSPRISPRFLKGYNEKSPRISPRFLKGYNEKSPRIAPKMLKGYYGKKKSKDISKDSQRILRRITPGTRQGHYEIATRTR